MKNLLDLNDTPATYPPSFYASRAEALPNCEAATGDITCDVCIVGGGFTGLSTALHLAQRGYNVHVVEAQRVGFGASGRNGGQVNQGQRRGQDDLENMVGIDHARELWKIGTQAVDLIRELSKSPLIKADFSPGLVHADHKPRLTDQSKAYVEKMQEQYGYCSGTVDERAGHIDPIQLAQGVARMAQAAGAKLHEQSRVQRLTTSTKNVVHTDKANITADYVVLACNGYIGDLHSDVTRRVMPINNFIVATEPMSPERQETFIKANRAVNDSKFVVNYFRFSDDHRLLFGGTESYSYRYPDNIAEKARKPLGKIFPELEDAKIDFAWGGTLGITMNRMPHYERYSDTVLSLSGFSGHGVAMANLSGQIAAETIAGQAERFDIMSKVPTPAFPGGRRMQHPLLVLAMVWYSLRDKL